nr:hypothetical protein [Klebsiella pneumoniae subsp. pneumoniae]
MEDEKQRMEYRAGRNAEAPPTALGRRQSLLDVGFNEPQEFIQIAGSRGEDICSVFVFASSIALRTSFATTA